MPSSRQMGLWQKTRRSSGGRVKPLEEAKKLDPAGINAEIKDRKDLMQQMVGQLYPSILWDEILVLRQLYVEKTGKYDFAG